MLLKDHKYKFSDSAEVRVNPPQFYIIVSKVRLSLR